MKKLLFTLAMGLPLVATAQIRLITASSGGLSALPDYAITNNQSSDWTSIGNITATNGSGQSTVITGGGVAGTANNWTVGLFGDNPITLTFDTSNDAIYSSGAPFASLGRSVAPWNQVHATNYFAKDSITTSKNTTNNIIIVDSAGKIINATGTADSTTFLRGDGTLAVPPGGSATPGGSGGHIQFNQGGAFDGTNGAIGLIFDRTNGFVGVNLNGARARGGIELGGTTTQAGMYIGSGTATNYINYDGMRAFGPSQDLKLGNLNGNFWHISGANGDIHLPSGISASSIGRPDIPVPRIHVGAISNWVANAIDVGSGLNTIQGTNSHWKAHVTSNITFAIRNPLSNVLYLVDFTNNTSTITHSNSVQWWDGPLLTSAPSLQQGRYRVAFVVNDHGTNGWVVTGRTLDLTVGTLHLATVTNLTTGVVTHQVTNFTGSGAIVLSNAPSLRLPNILDEGLTHTASNANVVLQRVASSNSVHGTNIVGVVQVSAATPLIIDANISHRWEVTNRLAAAMTIVLTNTEPYQEISILLYGEASGGTDRAVTIIGNGGGSAAIIDMDTFGVAVGASKAITVTNGNTAEINALIRTFHVTSTRSNVTSVVTRQARF